MIYLQLFFSFLQIGALSFHPMKLIAVKSIGDRKYP